MPVSLPGMALHRIKQRDRIHGEPCYCEADAAEVIRWHKAESLPVPEPSSLDAPCRHQYPHDGPCEAALPEPPLDVERLAQAVDIAIYESGGKMMWVSRENAERIVAEYTRLASEKGTGRGS
jgi:hypothetical protein